MRCGQGDGRIVEWTPRRPKAWGDRLGIGLALISSLIIWGALIWMMGQWLVAQ